LRTYYERASIPSIIDGDLEDVVILPYCGPRSMCPSFTSAAYTPFCDLFVGNFVLVWHEDPKVYPVWMGRGESDAVKDQENENYRKVYVQWWVLIKKGAKNDEELYNNFWLSKWKNNHVDPKQWVEISCVAFSLSARSNIIVLSMISISAIHGSKIEHNLDVVNNNSYAL
jgi:hypothetical protein